MPPVADAQFGKYRLLSRLGRGGMAEVWKAELRGPQGFSRTLVLKRMLPHLSDDPSFVKMFIAEARLSAKLSHANIVQVFDFGEVDGAYFIAMEYVPGCDLHAILRAHDHGPPPPGLGAFVVHQVCRALAYAHALTDESGQPLHLVHRDVSPSNVVVGVDGAVKLLDFGIAKALSEAGDATTRNGVLKGKLGYIAPEVLDGAPVDQRADQFAAGVVLHEALTARRLFRGASDFHTMSLVRGAKVAPPSLQNPEVPPALDAICLRALARDPAARFPGCAELAAELEEVVRELRWGAERTVATVKRLAPKPRPPSSEEDLAPAEVRIETATASAPATAARPAPARRAALRLGLLAGACAVVIAGTAIGVRVGKRAPVPPVAALPHADPPPAPAVAPTVVPLPVAPPAPAPTVAGAKAKPRADEARHKHAAAKPAAATAAPAPARRDAPSDLRRGDVVDPFAR